MSQSKSLIFKLVMDMGHSPVYYLVLANPLKYYSIFIQTPRAILKPHLVAQQNEMLAQHL